MAKIEEKYKAKLLVEGNDDQHVIWALCEKFKLSENFDVIDCGSYEGVLRQTKNRIKFEEDTVNILGVIVDADTNIESRIKDLFKILGNLGYEANKLQIAENGLLVDASADLPRLGIWVMPDNSGKGALEHFIEKLIPSDDKLLPYAENSLINIENDNVNRYNAQNKNHRQKALISTWLAWQEDPGTPMGFAITKSYLTTNTALCQSFMSWLNSLFNQNH